MEWDGRPVKYSVIMEPTNRNWIFSLTLPRPPTEERIGLVRDFRFYAFRDSTIGPMVDGDSDGLADDYPLNIDASSNGLPIQDDGTQLIDITTNILDGTDATVRNSLGWMFDCAL